VPAPVSEVLGLANPDDFDELADMGQFGDVCSQLLHGESDVID
jgi:hypothetical protein